MFRVSREIHFCYGHRLLDYDGKCRHLHGHNGMAVITLQGDQLDRRGMVVDFSDKLKRVVGGWIDTTLDHTMLLHKNDPVLPLLREKGERVLVLDVNPTAEKIAKLIYDFAASQGFPVAQGAGVGDAELLCDLQRATEWKSIVVEFAARSSELPFLCRTVGSCSAPHARSVGYRPRRRSRGGRRW